MRRYLTPGNKSTFAIGATFPIFYIIAHWHAFPTESKRAWAPSERQHLIVLYKLEKRKKWKYALDNKFCDELFDTREAAMKAAFEGVEGMICSVQK